MRLSSLTSLNLLPLLAVFLLTACGTQAPKQVIYSGSPEPVIEQEEPAPVLETADDFRKARLIADILYEAKVAYEDNRLMSPDNNNAYGHYRDVLQLDPGNQVALEGIEEIVSRYLVLADVAIRQGKLEEAQTMLTRAERLNPFRPELEAAHDRLEQARTTRIERFELDAAGVRGQSLAMLNRLAEIALFVQRNEATFLINARSDEEGRWIYKVMREAVGGYRLRGNIDISGSPNILVTLPAK
jgi:tetratricopeptide (TPR) repeat protein